MEPAAGTPLDLAASAEHAGAEGTDDAALARFIMDLRSRGLTDPALMTAFERLPRGEFIPGFAPSQLYSTMALPLPCGEEATDPFSLARYLMLLDIRPGLRVLEIGTGSGFLSAILARLGAGVTSYERYRTLLRRAERAFRSMGITTVVPLLGDGLTRLDRADSFDRIIVNGAVETMPQHLMDRLNANGIALAHRRRGLETQLVVWKKDLTGFPVAQECGPSRMGLMRAGIPSCL
ncbi:MAG: protein-L-isoaspartate O-methyltransferase [Rhizobiales bacterium PAR1]|nr:MAG: protein-L-isoaspartate O-methyltransferase [Rhizobiales bacterium PAR1]